MKYFGKSKEVCENVINQFKDGNIPAVLSQVFVHRKDNIPSNNWSRLNRFVMVISGTNDARGFRQWQKVGRKVKKGSKAIHILAPNYYKITKKTDIKDDEENEEKIFVITGFRSIPVFKIEDTEIRDSDLWNSCKTDEVENNRLNSLPFVEVAKKWNLDITSYNGGNGPRGYYIYGKQIAVGVENLSTWAHELMHAADDKNGSINTNKKYNEVVAELGGATLLRMIGKEHEADLGGCWEYITGYCNNNKDKTFKACNYLIKRISNCIDFILKEAENIENIAAVA